jgi:hypothetical protein
MAKTSTVTLISSTATCAKMNLSMHTRRLITALLGLWLGGILFLTYVATENFRTVEMLLGAPSAKTIQHMFEALGPERARILLRYEASEMNRGFFEAWGYADIAICAVVLVLLIISRYSKIPTIGTAILLLLGLVSAFLLTPQITSLGRMLDLALPKQTDFAELSKQFWSLHYLYSALMVVRILLVLGVLGYFLRRNESRMRKRISAEDLDALES